MTNNKLQINPRLLSRSVRAYLANKRRSPARAKTKGEVRGGGRKPWKQKGTGRARAGSIRSPLWRGGGAVFGPTGEENYSERLSAQERRAALRGAIELHEAKQSLKAVAPLSLTKTKEAAKFISDRNFERPLLVVGGLVETRAFRNLPRVSTRTVATLHPYDLLKAKTVIIVNEDLQALKARGEAP